MDEEKVISVDEIKQEQRPAGSMAATIVAAVAGMIVGTLPRTLWAYYTDYSGRVLYLCIPVIIGLFIVLLGGCRDKKGVIITGIFSLIGGLWQVMLTSAANTAYLRGDAVFMPYPLSISGDYVSALSRLKFNSDLLFPVIFLCFGVFLAYMLFQSKLKRK